MADAGGLNPPSLTREYGFESHPGHQHNVNKGTIVTNSPKLTPLQAAEARRLAAEQAKAGKVPQSRSEEEKAARKERVTKAKDALSRSVGIKGDHVAGARAAIKTYLQRLNEPNQPDDGRFEMLIEAPFRAPEKKKTNGPRF